MQIAQGFVQIHSNPLFSVVWTIRAENGEGRWRKGGGSFPQPRQLVPRGDGLSPWIREVFELADEGFPGLAAMTQASLLRLRQLGVGLL